MESMIYGRATVEVVEDGRNNHGGIVIEKVAGFRDLVWVRHEISSFTRCRRPYLGWCVDYVCKAGTAFYQNDNVRNFCRTV